MSSSLAALKEIIENGSLALASLVDIQQQVFLSCLVGDGSTFGVHPFQFLHIPFKVYALPCLISGHEGDIPQALVKIFLPYTFASICVL